MINLQLPIAQNLPLPLPRDTGNLYRGLTQVLRSSFPIGLDPSHGLLHPGPDAAHTARRVAIPVGDHLAPGTFFVPKAASGATVCFVHGTSAFKVCPYYWFISRLLKAGIQVLHFELDGHGDNPRPLCAPGIDENVPAALAFLQQQPEVDARRIGMLGVSLGGACILNAAPRVDGIKAIATVSTPHYLNLDEWGKLIEAVTLFNPEMLPDMLTATPNSLLEFVTSPIRFADSLAHPHREWDLLAPELMTTMKGVIRYLDPLDNAAKLGRTPYLVVNGEWDQQSPAWQAENLFCKARGPKALAIVPRRNHFTIITSRTAVDTTADWFRRWL